MEAILLIIGIFLLLVAPLFFRLKDGFWAGARIYSQQRSVLRFWAWLAGTPFFLILVMLGTWSIELLWPGILIWALGSLVFGANMGYQKWLAGDKKHPN